MATATLLPEAKSATDGLDLSESLYEVIDGIVVEKPPIGAREYGLAFRLGVRIASAVDSIGIGGAWVEMLFDFRPAVNRERRPAVAFVSAGRWPVDRLPPESAAWRLVPDLAIEIVSPTNPAGEMDAKVEEYFFVGVAHVWVIYPRTRRVHIHDSPASARIVGRGEVLTDETMLPGFRLNLDEFFGPPE